MLSWELLNITALKVATSSKNDLNAWQVLHTFTSVCGDYSIPAEYFTSESPH